MITWTFGLGKLNRWKVYRKNRKQKTDNQDKLLLAFSSGELKTLIHNIPYHTMLKMLPCTKSHHTNTIINQSNLLPVKPGLPPPLCCRYFSRLSQSNLVRQKIRALSILCSSKAWMTYSPFKIFTASEKVSTMEMVELP